MNTRLLQVLCALLFGVSLCGFAQEETKASSVRERDRQEVPKQYLAGRVWLTPEMYRQIDDAVRSGKRANADGILKSGRAKQKAEGSALRSRAVSMDGAISKKTPPVLYKTRTMVEAAKRSNSGKGALESQARQPAVSETSGSVDSEDLRMVMPSPGQYYMSQAFRLKIAGDGKGMIAYANAAIDVWSPIANAPEGEVSKEERIEALLRMANIQRRLLSDSSSAVENYRRVLELNPDDQALEERLRLLLSDDTGKEDSQ